MSMYDDLLEDTYTGGGTTGGDQYTDIVGADPGNWLASGPGSDYVYNEWYKDTYGDDPTTPVIEGDRVFNDTVETNMAQARLDAEDYNSGFWHKLFGKTMDVRDPRTAVGYNDNVRTAWAPQAQYTNKWTGADTAATGIAAYLNPLTLFGFLANGGTEDKVSSWKNWSAPRQTPLSEMDPSDNGSNLLDKYGAGIAGVDYDPIDQVLNHLTPVTTPGTGGTPTPSNSGGDVPGTGGSPIGGGHTTSPLPIQQYNAPNKSYDEWLNYGMGPEHSFYSPAAPTNVANQTAASLTNAQWRPGGVLTWTTNGPRMIYS